MSVACEACTYFNKHAGPMCAKCDHPLARPRLTSLAAPVIVDDDEPPAVASGRVAARGAAVRLRRDAPTAARGRAVPPVEPSAHERNEYNRRWNIDSEDEGERPPIKPPGPGAAGDCKTRLRRGERTAARASASATRATTRPTARASTPPCRRAPAQRRPGRAASWMGEIGGQARRTWRRSSARGPAWSRSSTTGTRRSGCRASKSSLANRNARAAARWTAAGACARAGCARSPARDDRRPRSRASSSSPASRARA